MVVRSLCWKYNQKVILFKYLKKTERKKMFIHNLKRHTITAKFAETQTNQNKFGRYT